MKLAILSLDGHNNYGNRLQNYALKMIFFASVLKKNEKCVGKSYKKPKFAH